MRISLAGARWQTQSCVSAAAATVMALCVRVRASAENSRSRKACTHEGGTPLARSIASSTAGVEARPSSRSISPILASFAWKPSAASRHTRSAVPSAA